MKKYTLIIIILVLAGLFGPVANVNRAQAITVTTTSGSGKCLDNDTGLPNGKTQEECVGAGVTWYPETSKGDDANKSAFENYISTKYECGLLKGSLWPGCFVQFFYGLFYVIPAFLLYVAAIFFNALVSLGLSTFLYKAEFVKTAWAVVRDLSNIFFILILLYVAIELILGIGHDAKKMIVKVIIAALLINFSMFFTGIVVDTSNILALVFYNQLNVQNPDGSKRDYTPATSNVEKDVSGALVGAFNPTKTLQPEFFKQAEKIIIDGKEVQLDAAPPGIIIGVLVVTGAVMLFAMYCFFVSGFSFLGRLVELFVLIIFSPFALMSSSIPILENVQYIGWKAWFHRLLTVSFMAPIFMFFLYFIFLLIRQNLFKDLITGKSMGQTILAMVLIAMVILVLLLKATSYAKKGSGQFGEALMKGAKVVGGLALGAATGGVAALGSGVIGGAAASLEGSKFGERLKTKTKETGFGGYASRLALRTADYGSKATFDIRKTKAGGAFMRASGMNLQSASAVGLGSKEGGYRGMADRTAKANEEESKIYRTKMGDKKVAEWSEERAREWDKDRNKAEEKAKARGERFDPNDYAKKNGARPDTNIDTADKLNADRQKAFVNNLGHNSLLGTTAFNLTKWTGGIVNEDNYTKSDEYERKFRQKYSDGRATRYEEEIAKGINDTRVRLAKMAIGGSAAVLTGGVAAGAAGAVIAGAGAGAYAAKEKAGEQKFAAGSEKQLRRIAEVNERIKDQKDLLLAQTQVLGDKDLIEQGITSNTGQEDSYKNPIYKVNTEKLREAIVHETASEQGFKIQLEELRRILEQKGGHDSRIEERISSLNGQMNMSTMKLLKYKDIANAEQSVVNTRNRISNLSGQKSDLTSKESKGGETKPSESKAESGGGGEAKH